MSLCHDPVSHHSKCGKYCRVKFFSKKSDPVFFGIKSIPLNEYSVLIVYKDSRRRRELYKYESRRREQKNNKELSEIAKKPKSCHHYTNTERKSIQILRSLRENLSMSKFSNLLFS